MINRVLHCENIEIDNPNFKSLKIMMNIQKLWFPGIVGFMNIHDCCTMVDPRG